MSNWDSFRYFFTLDIVPFTFFNFVYDKSLKVAVNKSESSAQLAWGSGRKPVTGKRQTIPPWKDLKDLKEQISCFTVNMVQ